MEKIVLSCEFNMDTGCVEVKHADGSMIAINCTKVENDVARNMYEASELDWLVYNALEANRVAMCANNEDYGFKLQLDWQQLK